MLGSIGFNYGAGYAIARGFFNKPRLLLVLAIIANLALLSYFKYANFFIDNLNQLAGTALGNSSVVLPLGISFFTFTQIAFLVDAYQGKVKETNFIHYTLFVTYFPHLIAGPVLHHKEMMPQFARHESCRINPENVAIGLTVFVFGLAKKVLIADALAEFSSPVFDAVDAGGHPMLIEAWIAALSYTLQLYFDFSAYSDMAIGLSLMFNVRLPVNFNSPYQSTSIIEFWRRWHMTLSRFLHDYLYIPLGGNRNGEVRRYLNLMITMLLGGLWHGAGWSFIIWGGLHGFYLMVNHVWLELKQRLGWGDGGRIAHLAAGALTFLAVVIGWVFFRAENLDSAIGMINGMSGLNGCSFSRKLEGTVFADVMKNTGARFIGTMSLTGLDSGKAIGTLILSMIVVFKFPNVQQVFRRYAPALNATFPIKQDQPAGRLTRCFEWRAHPVHAWLTGLLFTYTLLNLTRVSEFLYFRF